MWLTVCGTLPSTYQVTLFLRTISSAVRKRAALTTSRRTRAQDTRAEVWLSSASYWRCQRRPPRGQSWPAANFMSDYSGSQSLLRTLTSIKKKKKTHVHLCLCLCRSSKAGEGGEDLSLAEAPQHRWAERPPLKTHWLTSSATHTFCPPSLVASLATDIHHPDTVMREKKPKACMFCTGI